MKYKGLMEGWDIDEFECNDDCGLCSECQDKFYLNADDEPFEEEAA
jgi:hypothetical protein